MTDRKILVNTNALRRLLTAVDPGGFQSNALGVGYEVVDGVASRLVGESEFTASQRRLIAGSLMFCAKNECGPVHDAASDLAARELAALLSARSALSPESNPEGQ